MKQSDMKQSDMKQVWQGRVDAEDGEQGLRFHQVVKPVNGSHSNVSSKGVTFVGFASDLGVQHNQGRAGARQGPKAIRKAMSSMAWHFDQELWDAGDIEINPKAEGDALSEGQSQYAEIVSQALSQNQFVIGLGGGHEIGWASYQGCRQFLDNIDKKNATVGIINFDAHFDLRKPAPNAHWSGSSGTPFYQVSQDCAERGLDFRYACLGISESANTRALFNFAHKHDVKFLLDDRCTNDNSDSLIHEFLAELDYLYVTVCLDVLPASVAPGVSAPSALGISLPFMLTALEQIQQACHQNGVQWLMADIAELNPDYDQDSHTAKVAARLAYDIIKLNQK